VELTARMAGVELSRGSLEEAERYVVLATRELDSVPPDRRGRSRVVLAVARMARLGLGEDLRTLALINLGIAELWASRFDEAGRHLEDGVALARQLGRPYLEVTGLAHWSQLLSWRSFPLGAQRASPSACWHPPRDGPDKLAAEPDHPRV